jgi:hypothetical protein
MIIEVVIFFIWVLVVLLVGVIVTIRRRRRERLTPVDNVNALTFPQRNWLPLCVIIAIVSPLVVSGFKSVTHKKVEKVSVERNGAAYLSGDSAARDTSYHVATPPQH